MFCPDHCILSEGRWKCFKQYLTQATFNQAKTNCQTLNGVLAEPKTSEELEFIYQYFRSTPFSYIGINDIANENRFENWAYRKYHVFYTIHFFNLSFIYSSDNSAFVLNGFWTANNPDNYANDEHCLMIKHDFSWPQILNDYPCQNSLPYICQF